MIPSPLTAISFAFCLSVLPAAGMAADAQNGPFLQAQQSDAPRRGPELQIPGLPPIQLPPGTRVFGPEGRSSAPLPPRRTDGTERSSPAGENKQRPSQAKNATKPKPKGRDAILTDLFKQLGEAKDRRQARGIASAIERAWLQSGSDTADLLMQRALQAMKKKNYKLALRLLDKVVYLEPRWAEVWNQRATARYYADDPDGAIADIAQVLAREPRHFSALVGLGFMLRRAKQEKAALQVFQRALEINPQLTNIKPIIEKLKLSVEGQGI